jgi:hypothetical protein
MSPSALPKHSLARPRAFTAHFSFPLRESSHFFWRIFLPSASRDSSNRRIRRHSRISTNGRFFLLG